MKFFIQKNKTYFFFILVVLFFIFFFLFSSQKMETRKIKIHDTVLTAWLARNQEEQMRGLSIVSELQDNQAMLFIFPKEDHHSFWMKDMQFPIDIVWIDGEKKILFIKEYAQPSDYPEVYQPDVLSKYVLEVPAGFVQKHQLQRGDSLQFEL